MSIIKDFKGDFKYFSMFTGIGGFELGIERANPKWKCIGYSEVDKYAIQTFEKHFKGIKNYGDATTINPKELPDFQLLVGGFPCQAFSIAGKRLGFNETRGTLFFEIARILRHKRPRYFILENVKGLLSHDSGKTFSTILGVLTDLGYDFQWHVLNSKNHGVPQNRERIFIVGNLRGIPRPEVFPFGYSGDTDFQEEGVPSSEGERVRGQNISATIDANYWKGAGSTRQMIEVVGMLDDEKWRKFNESSRRVYSKEGIAPTVPTSAGGGHVPKVDVSRYPLKFLERNQKNIEGDYAYTIDGANTGGVRVGMKVRKLTPTECERLQGFPDGWTEGVSDTQRYKMLGNAVTVNVVKAVASLL